MMAKGDLVLSVIAPVDRLVISGVVGEVMTQQVAVLVEYGQRFLQTEGSDMIVAYHQLFVLQVIPQIGSAHHLAMVAQDPLPEDIPKAIRIDHPVAGAEGGSYPYLGRIGIQLYDLKMIGMAGLGEKVEGIFER